jgi:hypothetical protein
VALSAVLLPQPCGSARVDHCAAQCDCDDGTTSHPSATDECAHTVAGPLQ